MNMIFSSHALLFYVYPNSCFISHCFWEDLVTFCGHEDMLQWLVLFSENFARTLLHLVRVSYVGSNCNSLHVNLMVMNVIF